MDNFIELLIIVAVIAIQTFCGYIGNKYLGSILPIIFLGFVGFFLYKGTLGFNFKDIIMPFLGLLTLVMIYEGGKETKKSKIKKELEKMKAKDISKKEL